MSCVVSGDMTGDACIELEVVTEEALIADAGTDAVEGRDGRKDVWTWLGLERLEIAEGICCEGKGVGRVGVDVAVDGEEGLEVAAIL